MQIGCSAPTSGPLIEPDSLLRIATEAEMLGFDYVTVSDHVMIPTSIASRYPYSDSGEFPSGAAAERLEQLTAATFIAAATTKLRIVTSVMVVPHRPAVLTAKILATHRLSVERPPDAGHRRRLVRGGIHRHRRAAIRRARRGDRRIMMACKELWTADEPKFDGKYVKFKDVLFPPKPAQKSIPIWVGGESGPALRRTAKYGDAWYPIGTNPQFPMDTLTVSRRGGEVARPDGESRTRSGRGALAYRVSSNPGGAAERHGRWRAQAVHRRRGRLRRRHQGSARRGRDVVRLRAVRADVAATHRQHAPFRDDVVAKVNNATH